MQSGLISNNITHHVDHTETARVQQYQQKSAHFSSVVNGTCYAISH